MHSFFIIIRADPAFYLKYSFVHATIMYMLFISTSILYMLFSYRRLKTLFTNNKFNLEGNQLEVLSSDAVQDSENQ